MMEANISQKISKTDTTIENEPNQSFTTSRANSQPIIHSFLDYEDIETEFNRSYTFLHILGQGGSGEVHLVQHKISKKEYACKIISSTNSKMNDAKTMKVEAIAMQKLHHPNILTLHEVYETEGTIWMILEYANGGDLMHALASLPLYNERAIAKLFKQILEAVQCIHNQGIVHRDLKIDNVLFHRPKENQSIKEEELEIKIADFGLSAITNNIRTKSNAKKLKKENSLKEMWGTVQYFAPEVHQRAYGSQADIWSLGCILYEMLTGELAFPHPELPQTKIDTIMGKVLNKKPSRRFENTIGWIRLSVEARDLIKKMLKRNPTQRYDIDECLSHPWITGEGLSLSSITHQQTELLATKTIVRERSQRRHKRHLQLLRTHRHPQSPVV